MSARCCWSRSAARSSTARACSTAIQALGPAGRARGHPEAAAARAARSSTAAPGSGRRWPRSRTGRACRSRSADLIVGTKCGGSDGTSGITANPAIGRAFDLLVDAGAAVMFEELGELFGCEQHMAGRAVTPELGEEILRRHGQGRRYYGTLDHGSFGGGNISGGLSTVEEKSIGAYAKSGTRPIVGLLKPGVRPDARPASISWTRSLTGRCAGAIPTSTTRPR